jgi:hypothetical protein
VRVKETIVAEQVHLLTVRRIVVFAYGHSLGLIRRMTLLDADPTFEHDLAMWQKEVEDKNSDTVCLYDGPPNGGEKGA